MSDLISVIVPVYKVEEYLGKCVDSILAQTYDNLEILLVDDGSPDNCGKMCDDYAQKDNRIKVIHKENGGLSDARNAALKVAKGKYVAMVDSDDYISEDFIEYLYKLIKDHDADMSICEFFNVSESGEVFNHPLNNSKEMVFDRKQALFELLNNKLYSNSASGKLYKTEHFNGVEYPYRRLYEDAATTYKLMLKCSKIAFGARALYYYVIRQGSITQTEFNPSRLDAIEYGNRMVSAIVNEYPDLNKIAKCRMFDAYISLMKDTNNPGTKEVFNDAYNELKKLRGTVLFYTKSRLARKIKAAVSLFGSRALMMLVKKI